MSDKEIDVRVTANTADLKRGMSEAPGVVETATSRMRGAFRTMQEETRNTLHNMRNEISAQVSGMAGPFSGLVDVLGTVKGGFIAVAVAAATIGFSKSVGEAAKMTESAMDLSRALGITTNEASILQAALDDVGASPAELEAAAKGLSRQLRANEEDMRALGLATRDADGNLRPMTDLVLDSVGILNQYREGADRAIASQTLFGRGVDASSKLLLLNRDALDENRAAVEELGLMVGENAVDAWKDYDAATDRAGLSVKGMVKALGQSLMPILTDLIKLFNAVMPSAIVVVRGALSGLTAAFLAVKNGVVVLWETINAMVITVAEPIRALVEAISRAMSGDFEGAAAAIKGIGGNIAGAWERAMQRISDSSAKTSKQIKGLFVPDTAAARGGVSGDGTAEEAGKDSKTGKAAKTQGPIDVFDNGSFITGDKGIAEFIRKQFDAVNDMQGEIVREADKAAKEMADAQKRSAEQRTQIELLWSQNAAAAQMAVVDSAAQAARQQYELGVISYEELLALEAQHEQQRHQIRLQALNDRLALTDPDRDPVAYQQVLIAIEEQERQHQLTMTEIKNAGELERSQYALGAINSIQSGIASSLQQMMMGQMTLAQGLKAIWSSVLSAITGEIAKFAAQWIAKKLAMLIFGKTAALSEIATASGKAGANGVASWAAAPWPINMGAPAFGAAMAASALAFAPTASAAGGYDIPAGTNPITQLHAREMVLPEKQADVIRDMADGDSQLDATPPITIYVSAMDSAGVKKFLLDNRTAVADALKAAARDFKR